MRTGLILVVCMRVRVKMLSPLAQLPRKAHDDDYCYDVVAVSCEEVAPGVYRYGTGLAFEIVRDGGHRGCLSIDFRSRSSIWKTGMVLSNSVGTIDESYRGEVMAVFYHVMPEMPRYVVGDRIGQIKLGTTVPLEFVEAVELGETERGSGGYGSTGR